MTIIDRTDLYHYLFDGDPLSHQGQLAQIEAGSEVFNLLKQEKETNEKLNQEIRSLISENNSIKFENPNLKARVNELRNNTDAYSDQIDSEWERSKKTCHFKNWVPPTWRKVDLQNKYSPLLSAPSETESDHFTTYVIRDRDNIKPSFEEQLQTVHLQRKVNFLQQKLVEKSKAIPTNDTPEHRTAKKISRKTNIKDTNTNSSTQTKITVHEKRTGQDRRIVNTQTQGKDPPCAEKLNKDQPEKYKKTNFFIAGDSMLNYSEGQRLSNKKRVTKIHAFPGATTEDMVDLVRPLAYRSPNYLIIHAGTNDLIDFTAKDINC